MVPQSTYHIHFPPPPASHHRPSSLLSACSSSPPPSLFGAKAWPTQLMVKRSLASSFVWQRATGSAALELELSGADLASCSLDLAELKR